MKVVLDTNVIFSALNSKNGASFELLKQVLERSDVISCVSVALILEYESVLKRKHDHTFIDQFLRSFMDHSQSAIIFYRYRPTGTDAKDEMVLEAAINSGAEYIVTYNTKDFSGTEKFGVYIIKPQDFLKLLKEK